MRFSRNVCLESRLLLALQRNAIEMAFCLLIFAEVCRCSVPLYDCIVIAIEISLNEYLLKCHARIEQRLSGERAIIGVPAKCR